MPIFDTSTGSVKVANWGYQLQGPGGLDATELANETHDLMVLDFSSDGTGANSFSNAEISQIKDGPGGRSVAAAYLSIGEASEFRDHWDPAWTDNGQADGNLTALAPSWLGATNPDWPESRKVRYWDAEWQDVIFNDAKTGWLDKIVDQGFDAAYLDIVDAYYYWAVEAPGGQFQAGDPANGDEKDAARRMIDFIVAMTAHARETNPDFFVILQNGEFLIDALEGTSATRKAALLDAVGAIAVEDTYYRGNKDENNNLNPDSDKIDVLQKDFLDNGIPVFVVDYVNKGSKVAGLKDKAISDGFIPYAAPDRDLISMGDELGGGNATSKSDYLIGNGGNNTIKARGGNDVVEGFGGKDTLKGGSGNDRLFGNQNKDKLYGEKGSDRLFGGGGNDKLLGGKGNDKLSGGDGSDKFVFKNNYGKDKVLDFENNKDVIVLDDNLWNGSKSVSQILNQFGTQSGSDFVLDFGGGDVLTIKNATKAQLQNDIDIV